MNLKPSIFEYDDYRRYLRDFYLFSKKENKNFSFRFFARLMGYKTSSMLKMIMDGNRNIIPENIDKYVKILKLTKDEAHFFQNLVFLNQAKDSVEKKGFAEEILKSKVYRNMQPL